MKFKRLLNGSVVIMFIIAVSKLFGLVRDSLIAQNFGLSYLNDIYMFSIGTTMLFISISYGVTAALIPIHTYIKENSGLEERNKFISNVITVISAITLFIVVIGILGANVIVSVFASSFKNDINVYSQAVLLVRVMFISLIFVGVQSVITAVLQCHNKFIAPSLMPVFSNTIYIIYLLIFISKYGLSGFGVATVLGFLSMLLINIPNFKRLGYRYSFVFDLKDENLRALGKSMIPIVICSSLVQVNVFVVRAFAGTLQYGSISSLDYANKINMLVYEVFAQAISMVIYPKLSSLASKNNIKEFKEEMNKGVNLIFLLMIPAAFGLFVLRIPLISVYLKRGAFGNEEVMLTASALIYYIPTMILYGVRDVVNRGFFSLKETRIPMINSLVNIFLNVVFCFVLVKSFEVKGLALSNSLSTLCVTVVLVYMLRNSFNGIDLKSIFKNLIKIIISSGIMAVVVGIINAVIVKELGNSLTMQLISILISTFIGILFYAIILYIFRVEAFLLYVDLIFKKKK